MPLKTTAGNHGEAAKGRGATINIEGRFEEWNREAADDGWFQDPGDEPQRPKTVITIEHAKSVISRHNSPDVGFAQSINPYRGCAHGCVYCAHPSTPVLLANGRTLPISELRIGDEIYGTHFDGKFRRYTKAKVLAHWSSVKPAFRTVLEDGTELITSGDHRFLSNRGWKHVTGAECGPNQRPFLTANNHLLGTGAFAEGPAETDEYKRGYLCGVIRGDAHLGVHRCRRTNGGLYDAWRFRLALCDTEALLRAQDYLVDFEVATHEFQYLQAAGNQRAMYAIRSQSRSKVELISQMIAWPNGPSSDWCKGFLAGVFDAEGSFSQTVWRVSNTNHEIIDWICRCLTRFGFSFVIEHQPHVDRKSIDVIRMKGGLREHLRFFHSVRPAITRKLNLEGQAIKVQNARLRVVSIEPLGKAMRLFDITTTTEDFIANGVVSHNCFARPSHAYIGLSPGLDFETRLTAKANAVDKLREELAKPGYKCQPLTVGINTDSYQPIEQQQRITRSIIELLSDTYHPVSIITKSALIERDLDLLAPMAKKNLANVMVSVTTLDHDISRRMEPRTSAPARRIEAIRRLSAAGIPVGVMVAPVVPFLTDSELESILEAAANAGATTAGYALLRLPWEVKPIFKEWLEKHFPLKAAHVMSRVREMREGKENDYEWHRRMVGTGPFAELLGLRFRKAVQKLGLDRPERDLDTSLFVPPSRHGQGSLF